MEAPQLPAPGGEDGDLIDIGEDGTPSSSLSCDPYPLGDVIIVGLTTFLFGMLGGTYLQPKQGGNVQLWLALFAFIGLLTIMIIVVVRYSGFGPGQQTVVGAGGVLIALAVLAIIAIGFLLWPRRDSRYYARTRLM